MAERKRLKKEMDRKLKQEVKSAVERGKTKERRRAELLSKMIEGKTRKIQELNRTVGELRDQLQKGTTPQLEGLNLEEELTKELRARFRNDRVRRFGKKGDVLQTVIYKKAVAGMILYECKRTSRFSKRYVTQARRAMVKRSATYAVLVTTVFPTDSAGFSVSEDVFVVHPFGAGDLAEFLRKGLIELVSLKVSSKEIDKRAKMLLDYARTEEFRNAITDSIHSTHALRDLLASEMRGHFLTWRKRIEHYRDINSNIALVGENARRIIRGETPIKRIVQAQELPPLKQLPA